jgi:hypothetical protein
MVTKYLGQLSENVVVKWHTSHLGKEKFTCRVLILENHEGRSSYVVLIDAPFATSVGLKFDPRPSMK